MLVVLVYVICAPFGQWNTKMWKHIHICRYDKYTDWVKCNSRYSPICTNMYFVLHTCCMCGWKPIFPSHGRHRAHWGLYIDNGIRIYYALRVPLSLISLNSFYAHINSIHNFISFKVKYWYYFIIHAISRAGSQRNIKTKTKWYRIQYFSSATRFHQTLKKILGKKDSKKELN